MNNPAIIEAGKATRFKPGQSGNPKGRPVGSKNLSTLVQEMLADEELANKILTIKPRWWGVLAEKNGAYAMIAAILAKACHGDVSAANWIVKTGYGNKPVLDEPEREMRPVVFFDFTPTPGNSKRSKKQKQTK